MGRSIQINTCSLDSFEGLHQAIQGSHVEVMQLGRGKFRGSLSHVGIGDFSLSIGSFSVGVRTQRIATDDKLVIGMLLNASERVTHWSFDMLPADVLVMPPSTEHDGIFHGAAAYAAIRLDLAEVTSLFAGEPRLSDPAAWYVKNHYRAHSPTGWQQRGDCRRSFPAWRSSRPACPTKWLISGNGRSSMRWPRRLSMPCPRRTGALCRRRCVWFETSNIISTTAGSRPVHISEICAQFAVSRRSLHRAFDDMLGLGPVTFLRRKRLCAIHSALRESNPATTTIGEIAMQHGFIELGRFAHYYHSLFGEYPSETLYLSKHISRAVEHRGSLATG